MEADTRLLWIVLKADQGEVEWRSDDVPGLADLDAGDLTAVRIPPATANEIVAALSALLAQTTAPDLRLSDLFFA